MELAHPDTLFTSVLSFGEIRKGIELLPPSRKRREIEQWLDGDLNGWFANNLLPVTKAISNRWGALTARSQQQGKPLGNIDGLLAATAFEYRLTVVTHNTRHFEYLGVGVFKNMDPSYRLGKTRLCDDTNAAAIVSKAVAQVNPIS